MMFLITWEPHAFNRMQVLLNRHPDLKTDFIYDLRSLTTRLNREANDFGESRDGPYRLGFLDKLQVLLRIDEEDAIATVVDVDLRSKRQTG